MTLPTDDPNNGWEPNPGDGGAAPGTLPKKLFYLTDALGSTLGMLEKDGRMSSRYHYDEFGVVLDRKKFDINWPGPDNLFGYTGLGYDYYSDLNYARARYYKPELGRFISEDTYKGQIDNPLTLNLYTYVGNNPLIRFDPSGHSWIGDQLKGFGSGMKEVHSSWESGLGYWTLGMTDPFFTAANSSITSGEYWISFTEATLNTGTTLMGGTIIKQGTNLTTKAVANTVTKGAGKTVDDILDSASPGRATKGKTTQYVKSGDYDQAATEFDSLNPSNVKEINTKYGSGKTGSLPDGRTVTVRPGSTDGRPTIEIRDSNGRGVEIRYGE